MLLLLEQVVTPIDRGSERLLALQRRCAPGREEPEAVLEPPQDLRHREHLDARRRELDRERDTVQAPADLRHGPGVLVRQRERRLKGGGAVQEEPHRLEEAQSPPRERRAARIRDAEGGNAPEGLPGHPERLPARRQDAKACSPGEKRLGERSTSRRQVFAIVDDEEKGARSDVLRDSLDQRPSRLLA